MSDTAAVPVESNIVRVASYGLNERGTDHHQLRSTSRELLTAVAYVDLENLFEGYHNAFERLPFIDPERLIQEFRTALQESGVSVEGLRVRAYADFNSAVRARAYADSNSTVRDITPLRSWRTRAESLGLECIQPAVERQEHNIVDRMIAMDAIRDCHEQPHVSTFILVSGDAGFICLAQKLRERGKRIIHCFGRQKPASELKGTCHVHRLVEPSSPAGQPDSEAIVRYWLAGIEPDIRVPSPLALFKVVKFLVAVERVPYRLSEWAKRFTECEPSLGRVDAEGLVHALKVSGLLVPAVGIEDGSTDLVRAVDVWDCDHARNRLYRYLRRRLEPLTRWPGWTPKSKPDSHYKQVNSRKKSIQRGVRAMVFGRPPPDGE
jgi:uncharacterized LabA/DUF88 family protein